MSSSVEGHTLEKQGAISAHRLSDYSQNVQLITETQNKLRPFQNCFDGKRNTRAFAGMRQCVKISLFFRFDFDFAKLQ